MLNTPKALQPPPLDTLDQNRLSRQLFPVNESVEPEKISKSKSKLFGGEPLTIKGVRNVKRTDAVNDGPSEEWLRHAAKTSQVNEYENISPTPSTDL